MELTAVILPANALIPAETFDKAPPNVETPAKEPASRFKRFRGFDAKEEAAAKDPAKRLKRCNGVAAKVETVAKEPTIFLKRFNGLAVKSELAEKDPCIILDLFNGCAVNELMAAIVPAKTLITVFDKAPEKADTAAKDPVNCLSL